jgi:two-component sensor histidine kinase
MEAAWMPISMSDSKFSTPELQDVPSPADGSSRLLFGAGTLVLCVAGILTVATAISCHAFLTQAGSHAPMTPSLIYGAVLWLWWGGAAHILWGTSRKWPAVLSLSAKSAALQIAAGFTITAAHLAALQWTVRVVVNVWPDVGSAGYNNLIFFEPRRFGLDFLICGLIWTACMTINMHVTAQRAALHSLELHRQLSAAHLRALQMQLEPHFLFNTLNAITTLVDLGRNAEASETLSHLNSILKSTLSRARPEKVSLAAELEIVENYLAIEQVRFADRLRIEIRVDPAALDGLVPCFLLQPIVENAIRHGISQREEDGLIVTSIERSEGRLHLRVRDNGPGFNGHKRPGHGIGLKNTEERLSHFYKRYDMRVSEPESGGFEVSITIPYECAPR